MPLYRLAHFLEGNKIPVLPRLCEIVYRVVFGAVVPASAEIGHDTVLGYHGLGVVIHSRAVIGENVMVGPGVTIGGRSGHLGVPVIEDDVLIGAGARILGPIRVGTGSAIGANAVVIADVPPRTVVVGIPARVVKVDVDVQTLGSLPRSLRGGSR